MLPNLGIFTQPTDLKPLYQQTTSYFVLENAYWRLINLDTAFTSQSGPFSDSKSSYLLPQQVDWLKNIVKIGNQNDKRGLVFFSHHMHVSVLEVEYTTFRQQIRNILTDNGKYPEKITLWLGGDEHSTHFFEPSEPNDDILPGHASYTWCCGSSGMPYSTFNASIPKKVGTMRNLKAFDNRPAINYNSTIIGFPAFAELNFVQNTVTIKLQSFKSGHDINTITTSGSEDQVQPFTITEHKFILDQETGEVNLDTQNILPSIQWNSF
jgi:hypothetical protein